jgi:hypothetical protein
MEDENFKKHSKYPKISNSAKKYIRKIKKEEKHKIHEEISKIFEEDICYYPKGFGIKSTILNTPLYDFNNKKLEELLDYLEIVKFSNLMNEISDFFGHTYEEALEMMSEYLEDNDLYDNYDNYYIKKYGKTRKEVLENKLQTEEDIDMEIKDCMENDMDIYFEFTTGIKDSENHKQFINSLANIYIRVIDYGFSMFKLDNNMKRQLKDLKEFVKNSYN